MEPDALKTLNEILKGSTDGVNLFWTIYSTVAFALLGYIFTAKGPIQFKTVRWILAIAFAVFAFCNWHALSKEQNKLFAISQYVISELEKHPETQPLAKVYEENKPAKSVVVLHGLLDLGILTLVLAAPAIKRVKPSERNS